MTRKDLLGLALAALLLLLAEQAQAAPAQWCQTFLSHYHGKPVQLRHIMAGLNLGNGCPYQIFGYRFVEA